MALDAPDVRILTAIQRRADLTNSELGQIACLSPSQASRRLERLKREGYVEAVVARLDARRLGLTVTAFVTVSLRSHAEEQAEAFHKLVREQDEILECSSVTGDSDYLLKVRTTDLDRFNELLTRTLLRHPAVATVRSSITLAEIKSTGALPIQR